MFAMLFYIYIIKHRTLKHSNTEIVKERKRKYAAVTTLISELQ